MYHFSLDSPGSLWGTENSGKRNARSIHTFQSHGDQLRTIALQRESNVSLHRANKQCLQHTSVVAPFSDDPQHSIYVQHMKLLLKVLL
jgi:hypothetical protein